MPSVSFLSRSALAAFCLLSLACPAKQKQPAPAAAPEIAKVAAAGKLVVYSGRSETLIGPVLKQFQEKTGIETEVRWGDTGELAAAILEEGEKSPAQVFLAQDGGALASLAAAGRFVELPAELRDRVPSRWIDPNGRWIGLSGRVRVLVVDPAKVPAGERPKSLRELADKKWEGRIALAPSNASLQAHLAAWRARNGGEDLQKLLAGIAANKPILLPKNPAVVDAVLKGEADIGLVNHYYLGQARKQAGAEVGLNHLPTADDGSAFVNIAGAGILVNDPAAIELVRFLLGPEAQNHFATQTFEIPLVKNPPAHQAGLELADAGAGDLDFAKVAAELPATLQDLRASGLLP
jgi:iron(III) transport system substrate-binding protein